jgi:hypothetical protein
LLATATHTTDSSVEKRPGVDRRPARTTQASAWSVDSTGALTAGPNATGTHPSGCDPVERHRCGEGVAPGNRRQTLDPDRIQCAQAHGTATRTPVQAVAESSLSERHSPSNRSTGQPAGEFGERRSDAGATLRSGVGCWRHRLGDGADQPPPIRTTTQQRLAPVDRCGGGLGSRPSGRTQQCAPGWQRQAGAGERHRRWQSAQPGLSLARRAKATGLYPRHTAACVDSLDETRVAVSGIACGARRRHRGWPSGRSREQAPAGSTVPADTASAVFASVRRRHEPSRPDRASARSQRGGGRQRQEGNGRSDAVRLSTRGMLRRV